MMLSRTEESRRAGWVANPNTHRTQLSPFPLLDPIEGREFPHNRSMIGSGPVFLTWLIAMTLPMCAGPINVPNGSFESPATEFVDPRIDSWQMTAKPFWYDETGGFLWDQLTGVYLNLPPDDPDHIVNCDGNQALFLFAVPEVGLFQDYDSTDWANPTPTREFDVRFEPGKSYTLTVGVIGGGGNMLEGVTIEFSLYYRDAEGERITVAATSVTHDPALFPERRFIDFHTRVPTVQPDDPWAGQHLGMRLLSTVQPEMAGGFWRLDHVRLVAGAGPVLSSPIRTADTFGFTLQSDPGLQFEILAATDPSLPLSDWDSLGVRTNTTGAMDIVDTDTTSIRRYYRARQLP